MDDDEIQRLLEKPSDYSKDFTTRVRDLGLELAGRDDTCFSLDPDMNYSASHQLIFFCDENGIFFPRDDPKVQYAITLFISSKGPVAAFQYLIVYNPRFSAYVSEDKVPQGVIDKSRSLRSALEMKQYQFPSATQLSEAVPGFFRELDGLPSNVFDLLFSEISSPFKTCK